MYTIVGTFQAFPGKVPDLIGVLQELKELSKRVNGADASILTTVGGKIGQVLVVWQSESLTQYEERVSKMESNADYQALIKRVAPLVVPNNAQISIFRHM